MTKIGYFVPEFPGQTHIFFWREMKKLREFGIEPEVVSTRRPPARLVTHAWAEKAMAETTYLYPPAQRQIFSAALFWLTAGPVAWFRCLKVVCKADGVTIKQRCRLVGLMLLGARLSQLAKQRDWTHVHVHSCADAANIALFAERISRLPYSLTLHGPLGDYGPNQSQKWRHAQFSIVITHLLLRQVQQKLGRFLPDQPHVAPMGVEVETFVRDSGFEPWRGTGAFRIFACGRINRCKGHEFLIQAVARLRQRNVPTQLEIAGTIDSDNTDYYDELIRLIESEQLQGHVKLLGGVSEDVVRDKLGRVHVFSLASLHEPLGVVYMEAMAMSVPVVATDAGGVTELIQNGKQGLLVPPASVESLADALEQIASNPEVAIELGKAGRDVVENGFHSGVSASTIAENLGILPREHAPRQVIDREPAVTG